MSFLKKYCFILFIACLGYAYGSDQLIFAVDVIRHGDRTPDKDLQYPAYTWKEGYGELTPQGMNQEFKLGENARNTYIDLYHLLPNSYQAGTLYIRSSDFDRTLMSAEAYLLGLYPLGTGPRLSQQDNTPALPVAFQPVPIHTTLGTEDTLFNPLPKSARVALFNKYVFSSPDWQAENAKLQSKYVLWSKVTGFPINNLVELIPLGDDLYIRQLYHAPLPPQLSPDDVQTIINAQQWAVAALFKPQQVGLALSYNFLLAINNDFNAAIQQQTPLKYVLFSGHDGTILPLLSAMGAPVDQQIPYASDLNFMLFKTAKGQYYILIKFNGQPVNIPDCGNSNRCTLAEFKNFTLQD